MLDYWIHLKNQGIVTSWHKTITIFATCINFLFYLNFSLYFCSFISITKINWLSSILLRYAVDFTFLDVMFFIAFLFPQHTLPLVQW